MIPSDLYFPLSKREIITASESNSSSFPSDPLAKKFHGYEIYVTGVIAIYFYDLILHARREWSWYLKKQWLLSDLVFFILDKINTLLYCITILFLLHYTHHTPSTCESTEIVSLCYYALGISLQCLEILSFLWPYYSNSICLLISLFIYAGATSIFHVLNIFGFSGFTVGSDGNCYSQLGQTREFWVPIAFIMMTTFSWSILGLVAIRVYSLRCWNELEKVCWNCFLFDNGISYLVLNVAFQTINVIFILTKSDYIDSFVNTAPALIVTSICCQRLTVLGTKSITRRYSTSSPMSCPTKEESINRSNFTPTSPQCNEYTINCIPEEFTQQSSTPQTYPPRIPMPTPRISQDFTNSLITMFSSFTTNDRIRNSIRSSFWSFFSINNDSQPSVKSHKLSEGNARRNIRNSSRAESVNSSSYVSIAITNDDDNLRQTREDSIRGQKSGQSNESNKSTLSPPPNVYIPEGGGGKTRLSGFRPRGMTLEDQEDMYCFWYCNANGEKDVFLFPPIPSKNPNNYGNSGINKK